jgi:copper oxidase (laccase) domain-containing protein
VLEATIETMESFGARRGDIRAAIGPCISRDAYEVGPEFEARFLAEGPENARFFHRPQPQAKAHFDLPAYVESRLSKLELGRLDRQSPCSVAQSETLFSYRRSQQSKESDYGRQVAAIALT